MIAVTSVILMIGGGLLLNVTLNLLYGVSPALLVILLVLSSVFLYVIGALLMGRCVNNGKQQFMGVGGINHNVVFAFILVAIGLLLLGFNMGLLPHIWRSYFFSWPMALLILGIGQLFKPNFIWGAVLTLTGIFFLFSRASNIYPDIEFYEQFISMFWPLLIIIAGVLILLSAFMRPGHGIRFYHKASCSVDKQPNQSENNDGKINYRLTFSGTEQVILDPVFKGGNIEVTFGGIELDLRRTTLAEGDTFLNINVVFGGVEITAPDNWDIEIRPNRFAGGIEDSRVKGFEKDRTRKLIIIAKCTFGGIDIK
jgi:Predicted membrane protein (DUF2154).